MATVFKRRLGQQGVGCKTATAWGMALVLSALAILPVSVPVAFGDEITIPLKQIYKVDPVVFPTVSAQQMIRFEIPNHWMVSPSQSYLELHLQHSKALIPSRSHLDVIFNEHALQRIALTPSNVNASVVKIPLTAQWFDKNKLKLTVEQHYIDVCEDPLNPTLWTEVLKESNLHIAYQPQPPVINLGHYPRPLVYEQGIETARLRWILPQSPSLATMRAALETNVHLAAAANQQLIESTASLAPPGTLKTTLGAAQTNTILIGTPDDFPEIGQLVAVPNYGLINNRWTHRDSREPLKDDDALISFSPHPVNNKKALLLVTANTSQGLINGAKFLSYLAANPQSKLSSQTMVVTGDWETGLAKSLKEGHHYLEEGTHSFEDLGFDTQQVYHVNAPPITYPLPMLRGVNGTDDVQVDLVYSYIYGLNPKFSALEMRLNGYPLKNLPLDNPGGESEVRASITLPRHLLRPHNELVGQFHLYKDKKGYCIDNVNDGTWGIIHGNSAITVRSAWTTQPPLMHPEVLPYTASERLSNLHLIVPTQWSDKGVNALLAFTSRLGQLTGQYAGKADTYDISLGTTPGETPFGRNVISFDFGSALYQPVAQSPLYLDWLTPLSAVLNITPEKAETWLNSSTLPVLEQRTIGNNQYHLHVSAKSPGALVLLQLAMASPTQFEKLLENLFHNPSNIIQLSPASDGQEVSVNRLTLRDSDINPSAPSSLNWWQWITQHPFWTALIVGSGLIVLLVAAGILMALIRRPSSGA